MAMDLYHVHAVLIVFELGEVQCPAVELGVNLKHRVHPESIHGSSLAPHFFMLQSYSKMDLNHFSP